MHILILNGPNLNLLGTREPHIYGTQSLTDIVQHLQQHFAQHTIEHLQSNHEGVLIDTLQSTKAGGVVLNAGALSHYSHALADAIRAINKPVVEVHITNTAAREPFRQQSVIAAACVGSITGLGVVGYQLAIDYLLAQQA